MRHTVYFPFEEVKEIQVVIMTSRQKVRVWDCDEYNQIYTKGPALPSLS
jgi:hypothetical protein